MENDAFIQKRYGVISFISFVIGIICFFIVFVTPIRVANIGSLADDYITFFLTITGIVLSIIGILKKTEKRVIPIISLVFSSSFFIFWVIVITLLVTGEIEFAP
ncbi:hypothetical protein QUF81_08915 [Peribacillus simplex]|uniref:DUF4064 domain-containing protein n=1 Tax=Peribacillus simplex TaxID=1478 RepID=A0AAW7IQA7_9BACI|nr:hypothetical protein [Peribacillus simplex]AMM94401.1 hypothetical protein UP17_19495 [Peribacillus simplex]MDF9759904.1 vacuolar-type H+-ATPase subunit I/STV1 [Peribacillus simplex]MDM5293301.1 hypothetical protein [Peribacillus simplex]MDM5452247.1 hypothetical protein [Peribacillus simplex]